MKKIENIFENYFEKVYYNITPEESYIYNDIPLVFKFEHNGKLYFASTNHNIITNDYSFYIKPTTPEELHLYENNQITNKSMLINNGEIYLLSYESGKPELYLVNCNELNDNDLPNDLYLYKETTTSKAIL